MPIAVISSRLHVEVKKLTPVRRLRVSSPSPIAPAAAGTSDAMPAAVRNCATGLLPLRLVNRRIGQPRLSGNGFQLAGGIGGTGVADEVHQRDVLVAVGVEVALGQVDAVLGRRRPARRAPCRAPR